MIFTIIIKFFKGDTTFLFFYFFIIWFSLLAFSVENKYSVLSELTYTMELFFYYRTLINIFLCITQLGFCCVYFVFVAANIHDVVKHYFFDMSVHWYLLLLLFPMVLLNWVKSLKYLTPASLFASIVTVSGLVITFFYMFEGGLPNTSTVKAFSSWQQLPLYFGTAIYAFEGIGVVRI